MKPKLKIDTLRADAAFRQLAKFSPASVRDTMRAEAGSILKFCFQRTGVSKVEDVTIRARLDVLMRIGSKRSADAERFSINIGKRGPYGRVWRVIPQPPEQWAILGRSVQQTHEAGFNAMNRHFKATTWSALTAYINRFKEGEKRLVPLAKRSIGLGAQSWLQIAEAAGIDLTKVKGGGRIANVKLKAAREAVASDGRAYKNGTANERGTGTKYEITLMNSIPWGPSVKFDAMLARAVMGRVKYFENNVKKGVFDSLDKMLKAYPNIRVTPPPALNLTEP